MSLPQIIAISVPVISWIVLLLFMRSWRRSLENERQRILAKKAQLDFWAKEFSRQCALAHKAIDDGDWQAYDRFAQAANLADRRFWMEAGR